MFGIGMPELLLILAVALIVLGPKKLPEIAKSLGKAMGEFKRATNDLKQTLEKEAGLDEVRESLRETRRDVQRSLDAQEVPPAAPAVKSDSDEGQGATAPDYPGESASGPANPEGETGKPKDSGNL